MLLEPQNQAVLIAFLFDIPFYVCYHFNMNDYKYEIQLLAEEAAYNETGKEFYDLPLLEQYEIFQDAEILWAERKMFQAERLEIPR